MREQIEVKVVNGYLCLIHDEGELVLYEEDGMPLISLILDALAASSDKRNGYNLTATTIGNG